MTKRVDFEGFNLELPSNIDSEIDKGVWFDKEVSIWIEKYVKPGMVCIDAGANWGLFTLLMARKAGPKGEVTAFEPAKCFFDRLTAHVHLNGFENVRHFQIGLSDINSVKVCAVEGPPYRSTARIDYARTVKQYPTDEMVHVWKLDSCWNQGRIDFIKIDVDGSEYRLLLGGAAVIEQYKPIIVIEVEVADVGFAATEWLAARGYSFEIYQGKKVGASYVRDQVGTGVGTVNLLALPEGK